MRSFIRGVEGIARILTGLSFMVIILAVILQILGRSGWVPTFIWTAEISRFALLYLVAFGVGRSLLSGALV
ncbi:TRAP transporter small permease, partial [Thioclava sp. BHET1]